MEPVQNIKLMKIPENASGTSSTFKIKPVSTKLGEQRSRVNHSRLHSYNKYDINHKYLKLTDYERSQSPVLAFQVPFIMQKSLKMIRNDYVMRSVNFKTQKVENKHKIEIIDSICHQLDEIEFELQDNQIVMNKSIDILESPLLVRLFHSDFKFIQILNSLKSFFKQVQIKQSYEHAKSIDQTKQRTPSLFNLRNSSLVDIEQLRRRKKKEDQIRPLFERDKNTSSSEIRAKLENMISRAHQSRSVEKSLSKRKRSALSNSPAFTRNMHRRSTRMNYSQVLTSGNKRLKL